MMLLSPPTCWYWTGTGEMVHCDGFTLRPWMDEAIMSRNMEPDIGMRLGSSMPALRFCGAGLMMR